VAVCVGLAVHYGRGRELREVADASQEALAELPVLNLDGTDPAAVRLIQATREEVCQSPGSAAAWGKLGMVLFAHDLFDAARTCLVRAEVLDPGDPHWPYLQAHAATAEEADVLIPCLERAVQRWGDTMEVPRLRLAQALLNVDRTDEATTQFQRILRNNPSNAHAKLGLGWSLSRRGEPHDSLAYLERLVTDPQVRKAAHTMLAKVHKQLGNSEAAQHELGLAAELPDDPRMVDPIIAEVMALRKGCLASLARADQLIEGGRTAEAVDLLQQTVRDYPEQPWAWITLGSALIQRQDWAGARQALSKAAQLVPESAEVQFQWGVFWYRQGNSHEAEEGFRKAAELKPGLAAAHYNLGRCLMRRGEAGQAIAAFRTAVSCKPNFAAAHLSLGELLVNSGQVCEGVEHLRYAAALNPAGKKAKSLLAALEHSGQHR
jgi:tetratricopeptide (TPR) repeat protein